jgi:hypothetical protein
MKTSLTMKLCRPAVTGNSNGPSLYHLLGVIGKGKALGRIEKAMMAIG